MKLNGSKKIMLNKEEKKELLKIARNSIDSYFKGKRYQPETKFENLKKPLGSFVTLKISASLSGLPGHGQEGGSAVGGNDYLRGCIGTLKAKEPLYKVVSQMSLAAAFEDPRFTPLTKKEFEVVTIEISILSPLKKIKDPFKEIEIGEHGVFVKSKKDYRSGLFLPQVAVENNWDLEKFMTELCENKAGLEPDAWKEGEVDIYTFTAEVFSEPR